MSMVSILDVPTDGEEGEDDMEQFKKWCKKKAEAEETTSSFSGISVATTDAAVSTTAKSSTSNRSLFYDTDIQENDDVVSLKKKLNEKNNNGTLSPKEFNMLIAKITKKNADNFKELNPNQKSKFSKEGGKGTKRKRRKRKKTRRKKKKKRRKKTKRRRKKKKKTRRRR